MPNHHLSHWIPLALSALLSFLSPVTSVAASVEMVPDDSLRRLPISTSSRTDDFDDMFRRRKVRVAIPHSRTLYYIDRGQEKGLSADLVRGFENHLNSKYRKQLNRRPLTVYIYPVTRDRLFHDVVDGKADIATGNLTITKHRMETVDFVPLADSSIREVLVTGPGFGPITSPEGLSGRTVHVRPATSYHESLLALNSRLMAGGLPPVHLELLPDALESEDILEMVDAGMLGAVVMDNWIATAWAQLLPNVTVHGGVVLRDDARIGWAVRKGNNRLNQEIAEYFASTQHQLVSPSRYQQLLSRVKMLKNNAAEQEMKKFHNLINLFELYGRKYRFDPLLLTAMGYQESRLDQQARSHVGAIGIMQLMPDTGRAMNVGSITITEPNIHAGAKYLDHLMERYFTDAEFSEMDRALFAFAAYNAGPGTIARHRREAARRGLNPNVWFNNVEIVTAEKVGSETTGYVRNIYKYYAAYKLVTERRKDQEKALLTIRNGN